MADSKFEWPDDEAFQQFLIKRAQTYPPSIVDVDLYNRVAEGLEPFVDSTYQATQALFETGNAGSGAHGVEKLNPLHVEILLDQAADLLERAAAATRNLDELKRRQFQQRLEFSEFEQVDKIHANEIRENKYKIDGLTATAEFNGVSSAISSLTLNLEALAAHRNDYWVGENLNNMISRAATLLTIQQFPSEGFPEQQFSFEDAASPKATNPKAQAVWKLSPYLIAPDLGERALQLSIQYQEMFGQRVALEAKREALSVKKDFETANENFQLSRIKVARDLVSRKLVESAIPGSALNYDSQVKVHEELVDQDVRRALFRMMASQTGLKRIYGFDEALPGGAGSNSGADVYSLLNWVRRAIDFLSISAASDQLTVMPVSIRSLLNDDTVWEEGKKHGVWTFSIPENGSVFGALGRMLSDLSCLRIRGVSGFTVGSTEYWQLRIERPTESWLGAPLLPVWLGRVTDRGANADAEVAGTATWFNASLYGDWKVSLAKAAQATSSDLAAVKDVYLELMTVARPAVAPK
ncbi:hypothetical protein [Dongia rigui]|uniref:Uncharacterized protein n=1 Tax=Dongia rigui TaxID=940149 RepID=A0ABU5E170_9PROT|nr:hypothetical protein [Dongia rigui]MDY0872658.1 hypothetical protein [Dongia rigui]